MSQKSSSSNFSSSNASTTNSRIPIIVPENGAPDVTRPLTLDTSNLHLRVNSPHNYADHSPALSAKIRIPKKQYSVEDPLRKIPTPMFDKFDQQQRKTTPSSAATVLAMSGLFVVGILLILSGALVLILQTQTPFIITGCIFLGLGVAMLFVCVILQRKNLVKFVLDLNRDLYFLNMKNSSVFKMMFEERTELPLAQ